MEQMEPMQELKNIEGAVEAILFAAGYPVKYTKIAEVLGLDLANTKTVIEHMSTAYNSDKSTRGLNLLLFEETCQLCTKEPYAPYIREALGIRRGGNLSASSMEVLAIVAYNQPLTRSFVDQVRGVDSAYAFNSLIDKGLIEACGRLDAPGRPMLYITTEKFLRVFGLQSLAELPATETVLPPKEDTPMAQDGDLSDEAGGVNLFSEEIAAEEESLPDAE